MEGLERWAEVLKGGTWLRGEARRAFSRELKAFAGERRWDAAREGIWAESLDPLKLVAKLAFGLTEGVPVVLANPRWGRSEREAFEETFGRVSGGVWRMSEPELLSGGEVAIPTGGTGGSLKFAVHDRRTLGLAGQRVVEATGGKRLHATVALAPFHASGLMPLVRAGLSGGTVIFGRPGIEESGQSGAAVEAGIRTVSLVATLARRYLDGDRSLLANYDLIFLGGGPTPKEVEDELRGLGLEVWNTYGMTETGGMIACDPNGGGWARALPGVRMRLSEGGEIEVETLGLAKRYLGGARLGGWYATGDLGRMSEAGLKVEGRSRPTIITGGEKVDPGEVERVMAKLDGVIEAVVWGSEDVGWGEVVCAAVAVAGEVKAEDLRKRLENELANYKIPKEIILVRAGLPRDERGKIDWAALGRRR